MQKPRLIYYNDAHHFNAKRIEPPASIHMLQWPVDEVLGSGVDLLVLGLGYGDVYFHQSKVGRVIGQDKQVWENYIDWRIMRMVEAAAEQGTDQLREVIKRGKQMGMKVFPSLKLQDPAAPGGERCGRLKWDLGAEVCIGEEGRNQWSYDFADERVQQDKLAMLREVLEDYQADGIELDFLFGNQYYKATEDNAVDLMTGFMVAVRRLAQEIGAAQQRQIPIMARVELEREANLKMGLDIEAWFQEGVVDYIVGQDPCVLSATDVQAEWLPQAANAAGGAAYYRPPRRVYDERTGLPSIEMYRALGQTLAWQGYAGMYHGYLPWPFSEREHQILRELGYPEVYGRYDKRYNLQPREGQLDEPSSTPGRQLPLVLKEGQRQTLTVWVADDLEAAKADGEMRSPILTIRLAFFCIEDDIVFRFNGRELPWAEAEIRHERALTIPVKLAGSMSVQAPLGMSAHWFRYRLQVADLQRGANALEVEVRKFDVKAGFERSVNGVEIQTRYNDFVRPEGLEIERIAPPGG
jgi:hypothetical protein